MSSQSDSGHVRLIVVADTGAILSLSLSGLLVRCEKEFRIVVGTEIRAELEGISKGDDDLGNAARSALHTIEVRKTTHSYLRGEDEALDILAELDADLLISDDIKFVMKNRGNRKIAFSVILLGVLLEQNKITKSDFIKAVDSIFAKRNWDENLIYLTAKYIIQEY